MIINENLLITFIKGVININKFRLYKYNNDNDKVDFIIGYCYGIIKKDNLKLDLDLLKQLTIKIIESKLYL